MDNFSIKNLIVIRNFITLKKINFNANFRKLNVKFHQIFCFKISQSFLGKFSRLNFHFISFYRLSIKRELSLKKNCVKKY
jgi:hypothetical protein